jgi:uncharacterized protein (TIGR02996 family)
MPFTDEQPFLDAIFARYHDDGPRFIYADFLDDAGDPDRAELVRVQVALARMAEDHPRRKELTTRQGELLGAHETRWSEHLSDLVSPSECEFRRGVLDSVVMDSAMFLARGEELFSRLPLRRIRLREADGVMSDLTTSPLLANVRELDLCENHLGNGGVNLLLRSQFLKDLDVLDLGFNGIDDAGVHTFARASTLPKLTSLSLNMNDRITSAGVAELAESPFFTGLAALDVSSNDIDDAGVRAVISSKSLARLHTLRLSYNHIGDAGVIALARSELLGRMIARVARLELQTNEIGPGGANALAGSPLLSRCDCLDLKNNAIGNSGLAAIFGSQYLQNLKVLKVGRNQITDAGVIALRESLPRVFGQLRVLDLSDNRLTDHGIRILETANLNGAVLIDVSGNNQASAGGEPPVPVGELVSGVLQGVTDAADAAELRRRVAHPTMRAGDRPNQTS